MNNEMKALLFKQFLMETINKEAYAKAMPDLIDQALILCENTKRGDQAEMEVRALMQAFIELYGEDDMIKSKRAEFERIIAENREIRDKSLNSLAECISMIFRIEISNFTVLGLDAEVMSFTYRDPIIEAKISINRDCSIKVTILQ